MKQSFLTIAFSILTLFAFSQADFRPGYYITTNNDTVKGLVDFRGDIFNSKRCRFKTSSDAQAKEFLPGDIKGYRLNDDKFYESKRATINQQDSLHFLECLVKGELNVYFMRNHDGNEYYFVEDRTGKMTTLDNNEIVFKNEFDDKYAKRSNQYKRILSYYFQKYPDLQKEVSDLPFRRNEIVAISKEYHEKACTSGEKCIVYEKPKIKNRVKIGLSLLGGVYSTKYQTGAGNNFDGNLKYLGGAVEVQSQMKNTNEKMLFNFRLAYNSMKLEGERIQHSNNNAVINYNINISNVKINAGFSYVYPKYKVKPLIFAGPFYEWLSFNHYSIKYDNNTNYNLTNPIKNYYCYGLYFGAGVELMNHLKVSVTYDVNNKRHDLTYFYKKGFEFSATYFF